MRIPLDGTVNLILVPRPTSHLDGSHVQEIEDVLKETDKEFP